MSYPAGSAGYPAYAAANAGLTGLGRARARQFGSDRIRLNARIPGMVMTG